MNYIKDELYIRNIKILKSKRKFLILFGLYLRFCPAF
nr:MAG TPA: hypothetical protein [Caudoviricetes sp.]DAP98720.1 MAG TPA: hypothetical protein [Caudoviricetes sp.]